jgi:hypothetical protein
MTSPRIQIRRATHRDATNRRVLPRSAFVPVLSIPELAVKLFGDVVA